MEDITETAEDLLIDLLRARGIPEVVIQAYLAADEWTDDLIEDGLEYVIGEYYEDIKKYAADITLPGILFGDSCKDYE